MQAVTVLTSSRADYSIYKPLLQLLQQDSDINLQLIVFGTHTSKAYGYTADAIRKDGFTITRELPFVLDSSSPATIALSMAKTVEQFSQVWQQLHSNLILCLGDRYEMFAAVAASIPFSIPVAHIHGGETTLGAMDNIFRHSLTHMAGIHFAGTEVYKQRITELTGTNTNVYNTGALSIDNLAHLQLLSLAEFEQQFAVNMSFPTILTTFHPETVSYEKNEQYARELAASFTTLAKEFQIIITMPNADTMGNVIRETLQTVAAKIPERVFAFENLGTIGYLSAMKHCALLLGNTSSGFAEASYFPKWVINLGNRQDGRLITDNIKTIAVEKELIVTTANQLYQQPVPAIHHPYGDGNAAVYMHNYIKQYLQVLS